MDTFVTLFQGLPIVLSISLIFGLTALIRIYIFANPGVRRLSTRDRRQSTALLSFPFKDNQKNIITEDRRKLINRRMASHVITNFCVIH